MDKKITQLDSISSINNDAVFPFSQEVSGEDKTVKGGVDQIGDYIANIQDHSTLNTVSKKLIGAINEILARGVGDIEGTASGSVASFNDDGDNIPVKSLVAEIVASQAGSGTPSPSNVRAISGFDNVDISVTGKNAYSKTLVVGQRANSTTGVIEPSADAACTDYMPVKGGTNYCLSGLTSELRDYVSFYDQNKSYISRTDSTSVTSRNFTTPDNACYCILTFAKVSGQTADISIVSSLTPQLELGTTATTYEPYKGNTYAISLGSTVYIGTLNVTTGILTVTHAYQLFDGSENWQYSENGSGRQRVYLPIAGAMPDSIDIIGNIIEKAAAPTAGYPADWTASFNHNASPSLLIGVPSTITSTQDFKDLIANTNLQVVYELSEPVVINLTPTEVVTLLGENNIYANSGDVEVEYFNEDASQFNDLIETIITSSSSDYHVYSTNEKVVGRWIDGKPIYEKTFTNIAVQSSLSQLVDDSVSYGTLIDGSINIANGVGFAYVQDNDIFLRAYVSSNKLYVAKRQATDWAGSSYAFIYVKYTKSTD